MQVVENPTPWLLRFFFSMEEAANPKACSETREKKTWEERNAAWQLIDNESSYKTLSEYSD